MSETRAIPAWAGKPARGWRASARSAGHPRVGGETFKPRASRSWRSGPSPRGRGNQMTDPAAIADRRAIPAWAGKPPEKRMGRSLTAGHPRVGGETRRAGIALAPAGGPSPRGRGNLARPLPRRRRRRAIPAWAGKPVPCCRPIAVNGGHPRVGGETLYHGQAGPAAKGPSPRGRGNHQSAMSGARSWRAIPAWAGKPRDG